MVEFITNAAEIESVSDMNLENASSETKDSVENLDKPLNYSCVEFTSFSETQVEMIDDLDRPLYMDFEDENTVDEPFIIERIGEEYHDDVDYGSHRPIEENMSYEKTGGSYRDVKKASDGDVYEVHHIPADSVSNLERDDGPAIRMEIEDHRQTASYGSSMEAREYREKQRELIENGDFKEAVQMDIDDIHDKFGSKYDDEIDEMLEYVEQLDREDRI